MTASATVSAAPDRTAAAIRPTPGRIVHYRLSPSEADRINDNRYFLARTVKIATHHPEPGHTSVYVPPGYQEPVGSQARAGDVLPAIVTKVGGHADDPYISLQVFLDGNDQLWRTEVHEGDGPGQWTWPPRVGA